MKKNTNEPKFSSLKIKRIIQENKEIGKIANMTPFVISKSLEYLLKDILTEASKYAVEEKSIKLHTYHLKKVIKSNPNYSFLNDIADTIPNEKVKKRKSNNSNSN